MSAAMALPAKSALDSLPPKRRAFVLYYVGESAGNATDAARRAEYGKPEVEGCRLLKNASVQSAIAEMRTGEDEKTVATIYELRQFWTAVARGEVDDWEEHVSRDGAEVVGCRAKLKDKLKASELLGKSQGAFVERKQVDVRSVAVRVQFADVAHAAQWAAGEETDDT
jgi:phage terminase small subunit